VSEDSELKKYITNSGSKKKVVSFKKDTDDV
jgi:hypothetical protein